MRKLFCFGAAVLLLLLAAVTAMAAELPMNISVRMESGGVDLTGQDLSPDREYRFPILVRYEDEVPSHLREEEMEGKRFTVTIRQGGDALYTPTVEAEGGRYYLVVKTKPSYATKAVQAQLLLRLRKEGGGELSQYTLELSVGSSRMSDEELGTPREGEVLRVDNNFPVVTKKQFQRLAEANRYRPVTLDGDGWEFTVSLTDLPDLNLYSTGAASPEVLQSYPDRELYFLSFPASPNFGTAGKMVLDVERLTEFDGEFYLYRRLADRLYYLKSEYDEEEGTLTFYPSQLGSYIIADGTLGDVELTSVSDNSAANSAASSAADSVAESVTENVDAPPNPNTGGAALDAGGRDFDIGGRDPDTVPVFLWGLASLAIGLLVAFRKG